MKQIEKWGNVDKYPNRITDATSRMRPTLRLGVFFVPEGHSGSLLTECSCGAKNPGKARHILRPRRM